VPPPDASEVRGKVAGFKVERRGVRSRATPITSDLRLRLALDALDPDNAHNRFKRLHAAALDILKSAGLPTLEDSNKLWLAAEEQTEASNAELDRAASAWLEWVCEKKGELSREGVAAAFLHRLDKVERWMGRTAEEQAFSTIRFADAWHWLHLEVFEHELAYGGLKRQQDLARSAPARTEKKAKSEEIIQQVYRERSPQAKNREAFKLASSAAPLISGGCQRAAEVGRTAGVHRENPD
jgi:hypothetical protein